MIGQKVRLEQKQQKNRTDNQRDPGDQLQGEPKPAFAYVFRPGEKLDKNIAWQLPPESVPHFRGIAELRAKLGVEHGDFRAQHDKMHKRIGMGDDENNRRENKKGDERQIDAE